MREHAALFLFGQAICVPLTDGIGMGAIKKEAPQVMDDLGGFFYGSKCRASHGMVCCR